MYILDDKPRNLVIAFILPIVYEAWKCNHTILGCIFVIPMLLSLIRLPKKTLLNTYMQIKNIYHQQYLFYLLNGSFVAAHFL